MYTLIIVLALVTGTPSRYEFGSFQTKAECEAIGAKQTEFVRKHTDSVLDVSYMCTE